MFVFSGEAKIFLFSLIHTIYTNYSGYSKTRTSDIMCLFEFMCKTNIYGLIVKKLITTLYCGRNKVVLSFTTLLETPVQQGSNLM